MPKVSPLILAAPEATSRICSTLCTLVPSLKAWWSQVVRLYRFRMWHMVESAVSSTEAAGTLHTAIPAKDGGKGYHLPNVSYFFPFNSNSGVWCLNLQILQHLLCTNSKFLTVMTDRILNIIVDKYVQTYFFWFFITIYCVYKLRQTANRPLKPQKESTEDVR